MKSIRFCRVHFQRLAALVLCQCLNNLPALGQSCPASLTDYKGNGSGKYCIKFSSDPGVASVTFQGVSLSRSGSSNLYTNGFNCNGSVSYPSVAVVTIGSLTCTYPNGVLPISLISFKGTNQGEGFNLTWETASEVNNEFFMVERSHDGSTFQSA